MHNTAFIHFKHKYNFPTTKSINIEPNHQKSKIKIAQMASKTDHLSISRLKVRCEIGFSEHEIGKLQEINISLRIYCNTQIAATCDDIRYGVDLKPLSKHILNNIPKKKYALIETIANEVAHYALTMNIDRISKVQVTVEKPHAIRFTDWSSVTIQRCLKDYPLKYGIISIGSNINPQINTTKAIQMITDECGDIMQCSANYITTHYNYIDAVEDLNEPPFINTAIEIGTYLNISTLKHKLRAIEAALGRRRDPNNRYIAREIDLDLMYYGLYLGHDSHEEENINDADDEELLLLNDKELREYNHILLPIAEIKPNYIHPNIGMSLYEFAKQKTHLNNPFEYYSKQKLTSSSNNVDDDAEHNEKPKVAIITGGVSKIGEFITRKLHSNGYNVLIHCIHNKAKAQHVANELNERRPSSAKIIQCDFTKIDDCAIAMVDAAYCEWHRLDLVVNNASLFYETKLESQDVDFNNMNELFLVNAIFPLLLVQSAIPYLKQVNGSVVNICDIHSERPLLHHSCYCASKAALVNLTKSTAKDLAQHEIRVNGINPGIIAWNSFDDNQYKDNEIKSIPLKKIGNVQHIADALWFLVNNSYITGQIINIDGGRTLNQ